MTRIIFEAEAVRRVVEHSINAPRQGKMAVGFDMDTRKTITEDVEVPAVLLVHDDGVYLMSNGEPRDIVVGETSFCAYAKGCHPKKDPDWWDTSRALVGGDDFGETLPWAREIKAMIDAGHAVIEIEVNDNALSLVQPSGRH